MQRSNQQRGNAFIEFALVFSLMMMFMAGAFELGRAIWIWANITHSVEEGVRFAAMHSVENPAEAPAGVTIVTTSTDAAIEQIVKRNANGLNKEMLNVQTVWSAGGVPGSDVTVTASYPFEMVIGPLLGDVAENMTIQRTSSAPVIN